MKNRDEQLLAEAYQTILENSVQQSVAQTPDPKIENAVNHLKSLSQNLNPRLPKDKVLQSIHGITVAFKTLSDLPSPLQQQAKHIYGWLSRVVPGLKAPAAALTWGPVATQIGDEIKRLLSSNSQQPVKEASSQPTPYSTFGYRTDNEEQKTQGQARLAAEVVRNITSKLNTKDAPNEIKIPSLGTITPQQAVTIFDPNQKDYKTKAEVIKQASNLKHSDKFHPELAAQNNKKEIDSISVRILQNIENQGYTKKIQKKESGFQKFISKIGLSK